MASILTNYSAMTALQTLRGVNNNLGETQARISTGLKVRSGKDNAAYFNISSTMRGDSGMYKSINEGLSLTRNSIATARSGAEQFVDIATEFVERLAFAQSESLDHDDVVKELAELTGRMKTVVDQSTFNGDDLVNGDDSAPVQRTVVSGVTRAEGSFGVTKIHFNEVALGTLVTQFTSLVEGVTIADATAEDAVYTASGNAGTLGEFTTGLGLKNIQDLEDAYAASEDISADFDGFSLSDLKNEVLSGLLDTAQGYLKKAIDAATSLGVAEKSIEVQQDFLSKLTDEIDGGIGGMIDADMEQEAARMQALQVQQQLATQSLSIANQNPQNILALFR